MRIESWELIKKCGIWRVLGVTECDSCASCKECWGDDEDKPDPRTRKQLDDHNAMKSASKIRG